LPKKYPVITTQQAIDILLVYGYVLDRTSSSHSQYVHPKTGILITVQITRRECGRDRIKSMISNMKISREEFYGAIKSTAKKI